MPGTQTEAFSPTQTEAGYVLLQTLYPRTCILRQAGVSWGAGPQPTQHQRTQASWLAIAPEAGGAEAEEAFLGREKQFLEGLMVY